MVGCGKHFFSASNRVDRLSHNLLVHSSCFGSLSNSIMRVPFSSISYLAVKSSAEAVRVLVRRGDQPSLKTAFQVLFQPLESSFSFQFLSVGWMASMLTKSQGPRLQILALYFGKIQNNWAFYCFPRFQD